MSSDEPQIKYQEVSPFQISEGFTPTRSRAMEPVKTSRIFLAAVAANLSAFAVGTCLGWTSPIAPKLKSDDTSDSPLDHKIDSTDDAWISSIVALGALVAPFVAGPLADKIGRKWVLLSSSIFFVIAYILMMIGGEVWVILLARLIQGFGVGFVMTAQPMYVGEIATDSVRGATGSLMQLFIVAGILYVYAIGPYVSYQALQWCCLVVPIVFDAVFFFMPESPYYYAGKGRKMEALKSLQFLRGQSAEAVQDEMATIQAVVEESMANKGTIIDIIRNPGNRKALIISCGLISFQQLSGINVVLFNSQSIFESANTGLDPAIATIIIGIVQVASSGLTPIIADRLGRKVILLTSAGVMSIGLAALGAFFYIQLVVGDISNVTWLPVPALVVYNIVYCVGFGPLPWAVLGEMFPANVKSIASSLTASTCWILGFLVTYFYPALDKLGSYYAFWLFGIFCVAAFFFVLLVVMETKGLSLQEIQDRLNGKKASLAAAPLVDRIGRKWILLSCAVFTAVSYILMIVASDVWVIIVGRLFQGFGSGLMLSSLPMYLAEISTADVRGATGSMMNLFLISGALYCYCIGPYVSYLAFQWFCFATPIVFAVIFVFIPESPFYYIGQGRQEEAVKSLQFLRGQSAEGVKDELLIIQTEIEKSKANKGSIFEVFKNPGNRKALIITACLIIFQQLSGNTALLFNLQTIFETANTGFDPAIETIIIGVVQVAASGLTPLIVDRLGRKIILMFSTIIMSIALAAMGAFFYIELTDGDISKILWLPVTSLVIYMIMYSISLGSLPWVLMGEMFPSNVKSIAGSLVSSTNFVTGFVMTYIFPLLDALGTYYVFWLFAVSCFVAFFFTLFMVMETKGLTLQEIQDKLHKKDSK